MSEYRQCCDSLSTHTAGADPLTEGDVLSESTDLDTLLAAILGETDSHATIQPAETVAADDDPRAPEYAFATQPLAVDLAAVPAAWLAGPLSEGELKEDADSPDTPYVGNEKSPDTDLAALRNRLQGRGAESPHGRFAWPIHTDDRELTTAVAESDLRAGSKLLVVVDERETTPSGPGGVSQGPSDARQSSLEATIRPVHRPRRGAALPQNARGLSLILVGVAVVISSALITLNAISRAFSPPAVQQGVGAASDGREVAAETAAVNTPAIASQPPATSASSGLRDSRTRPSSSSAVGRPNRRAVPSAPSPRGAVDAISNQVPATAAPPEPSSDSEAPTVPSENPGPAASVTSAPLTTITEAPITPMRDPVGSAGGGEIPDAPQPPGQTQAEPPIVSGLNPLSSAAATTSRTAPRLIQGGTPEYPSVLRAARVRGRVDVQLTIDHTGRVIRAAAVSGPPALREAAERAVRGWRYEPATVNGVHAPAATTVSFYFEPK